MKPSQWPDYLNDVLAKSPDKGGQTLAEHTWDVLEKLAALHRLRPRLTELAATPQLWHLLFWTCLLHDFGKAARGFQHMLASQGKDRWPERHEVLSLAFFDWIAPSLSETDQRAIVAAIASHHKDADMIREIYHWQPDSGVSNPLESLVKEIDADIPARLWQWIEDCAENWMRALDFTQDEVHMLSLMSQQDAVMVFQQQGATRTRHRLTQYRQWVKELDGPQPAIEIVLPMLLRGLTTTADHMASSQLPLHLDPIQEDWRHLAERILKDTEYEPYFHQEESASKAGKSALLVAPTGSGKTEAALYWSLGDGSVPVPRLFYTLPYQASMNAMYKRLGDSQKGFGEDTIGIQHGRALQAMYLRFLDYADTPQDARDSAKLARNIDALHARPIKVFSPYQMLKAAFSLRGFEAMFTDYAQAAFIFDEIHAYEPKRLALILAMIRYLREQYQARFFVMSATFPNIIRAKLLSALDLAPDALIKADSAVFQKFRRHRLHLIDGDLLGAGIERIRQDISDGKTVLACVNTVKRAQQLRKSLRDIGMSVDQIVLIHSRFIIKDRISREMDVMARAEIGKTSQPFVLIATQVVEVSLNIDLDTIYTDPAPLEALLQRFGRVNRECKKGICPVHVFRQPDDGQHVYDDQMIRTTLAELTKYDGQEIDEAKTDVWLNDIYADTQIYEHWQAEYTLGATNAALLLRELRPFNSNPLNVEQFEQMFESVDVLPDTFERTYLDLISQEDYLEASQYFVSISTKKYQALRREGKIALVFDPHDPDNKKKKFDKWMVRLPYSEKLGLQFEPNADEPDFD